MGLEDLHGLPFTPIALGIPLPSSTTQGFDPLSGLMDEQEAENDLDKLDPILDGLYYEEI